MKNLEEKEDFWDKAAPYMAVVVALFGCYFYYFCVTQGMPISIF